MYQGARIQAGMAAAMLAVALMLRLAALATSRSGLGADTSSVRPVSPNEGFEGILSSQPFANAEQVTLAQAQKLDGFDIPRPDDPVASDKTISTVWVDTSTGEAQIEIDYSSGVSVELGAARANLATTDSQTSFFKDQVAEEAAQTKGRAQLVSIGSFLVS